MPRKLRELEDQTRNPEDVFKEGSSSYKFLSSLTALGDKLFQFLLDAQRHHPIEPNETKQNTE